MHYLCSDRYELERWDMARRNSRISVFPYDATAASTRFCSLAYIFLGGCCSFWMLMICGPSVVIRALQWYCTDLIQRQAQNSITKVVQSYTRNSTMLNRIGLKSWDAQFYDKSRTRWGAWGAHVQSYTRCTCIMSGRGTNCRGMKCLRY